MFQNVHFISFIIGQMSLKDELSSWGKQSSKRKQEDSAKNVAATRLRERGNDLFKLGEYAEAERHYSASIVEFETIEALANRALARLKLQNAIGAISDCDTVLKLDKNHAKAYARRGLAFSQLGDHQSAVRDLRLAEALEPTDKALRREREREEAIILASNTQIQQQPHRIEQQSTTHQAHQMEQQSTGHQASKTQKVELTPKAKQKVDGYNQQALVEVLQTSPQTKVPMSAPQTSFTFMKTWRELQSNPEDRKILLFSIMTEQDYARCFKDTLEPDMMLEMLLACSEAQHILRLLEILSKLRSFALAKMMLSTQQKAGLIERMQGDAADRARHLLS